MPAESRKSTGGTAERAETDSLGVKELRARITGGAVVPKGLKANLIDQVRRELRHEAELANDTEADRSMYSGHSYIRGTLPGMMVKPCQQVLRIGPEDPSIFCLLRGRQAFARLSLLS